MGLTGHFQWDLPVILNGITRSLSVGLSNNENIQIPSDVLGYEAPRLSDSDLTERIRKFFTSSLEAEDAKFDKVTFYISEKNLKITKDRNYKKWRTKALYIGNESARIWDKIEDDHAYEINIQAIKSFLGIMIKGEKVDFKNIDNIVSLGCGNGITDNAFVKNVTQVNDSISYIPIDINPMMVHFASQNIDPTIRIPFAIIDDFEENVDHIENIINEKMIKIRKNNFFMMLGVTFSNLEGTEVLFFNKVKKWMGPNDYFLIDLSLNSENDKEKLRVTFEDDNYKKLLYNSLIKRKLINTDTLIDKDGFTPKPIKKNNLKQQYTDLESTTVYSCKYKDTTLLISKRYNVEDIASLIGTHFKLIELEDSEEESKKEKTFLSQFGKEKAFFLFKLT